MRWRVPDECPPELAEAADIALQVYIYIMRGWIVGAEARDMLAAAKLVREEICGAPLQRHTVEQRGVVVHVVTGLEGSVDPLEDDLEIPELPAVRA